MSFCHGYNDSFFFEVQNWCIKVVSVVSVSIEGRSICESAALIAIFSFMEFYFMKALTRSMRSICTFTRKSFFDRFYSLSGGYNIQRSLKHFMCLPFGALYDFSSAEKEGNHLDTLDSWQSEDTGLRVTYKIFLMPYVC